MKGFTQLSLAALAAYASATAIGDVNKRDSTLKVTLTAAGNTEVKVAVTNNGDKALNLLSKGTFLDEANPVEKVTLYAAGSKKVPFEGIKIRLLTTGLSPDDFVPLAVGETKEVTVETAALHSLEEGGNFDVFAQGRVPYAEEGSTELAGTLAYESNKLSLKVDGAVAATVHKALDKRTVVGSSCTGTRLTAIRTALSDCQRLASAAASAASSGTKLQEYFKSTTTSVRNEVSARLRAVASDCAGGSATTTNCNDPYGACSSNVLAYTVPSQDFIAYCNLFFNELPALTSTCHGQDKATTVIHEECHAPGVYSPGTDDLGYGYAAATRLSTSQALNNADNFALYANAIYLNC